MPLFISKLPSKCPLIFRDPNTGAGQGFTDLAAAVQLRLRVAYGLFNQSQSLATIEPLMSGQKEPETP
jgi:hypothetical protein